MDERDWLAERFQQHRPRLRAIACRMLGSTSDADEIDHLEAWPVTAGRPPTLTHPFNWKKASMAAALCYGCRGGGAQLAFHVTAGNYDTDRLIAVLEGLRRFLGGEKATLVWDGLPSHRSAAMREWLNTQRSWLVVERLPAYAPELNPVEGLWSSLKAVELANLASRRWAR